MARAPPSPGAHGSGESESAAGRRTHGLRATWGEGKSRGAPGGVTGAEQVKRDSESRGRSTLADFYLLPRTERSAERTGATAQAPVEAPARAPPGRRQHPRTPGLRVWGGPGLPRRRSPAGRTLSFSPLRPGSARGQPGSSQRASAGRSEGKPGSRLPRPRSAAPTRVEGGAGRSGGAERLGPRPSRPAGPRRRRKKPIVRREIHFWGPSESPSFF